MRAIRCETSVCRDECKVHKKRTGSDNVSALWEGAIAPLVLDIICDKKRKLPLYETQRILSKLLVRNNLNLKKVEESFFLHVYQSRDWMSSRSVYVDVILQFEHSSLVAMFVVVLCNVRFLNRR